MLVCRSGSRTNSHVLPDSVVTAWTCASGLGFREFETVGTMAIWKIHNIQQAPCVASEREAEQRESSVLCFASPPPEERPHGTFAWPHVRVLTSNRSALLSFNSYSFPLCEHQLLVNQAAPTLMCEQCVVRRVWIGQSEGTIWHHRVPMLSQLLTGTCLCDICRIRTEL